MKKQLLVFLTVSIFALNLSAQQKVKDGTVTGGNLPNKDALLELESNNKGLLHVRVTLIESINPSPLTAHVAGMMVYNTATSKDVVPGIYYNDGTRWVRSSKGDTGATGPQGPIGLTGATGPQGPIGLTGPAGPQGIQGLKGDIGATGPQGVAGANGADGAKGDKGDTGDTGPVGPIGPTGPTGAQGGIGLILDGTNTTVTGTGVAGDEYKINTPASTFTQNTTTGVITHTNEAGTQATANVVSTNTGNLLTVGTDGGAILNATAIAVTEPWYNVATNTGATSNTQDIYQMGKVGINTITPTKQFEVAGDVKSVKQDANGNYHIFETNASGLGGNASMLGVANTTDLATASNYNFYLVNKDQNSLATKAGTQDGAFIQLPAYQQMTTNDWGTNRFSEFYFGTNNIFLDNHNSTNKNRVILNLVAEQGVNFKTFNGTGTFEGDYVFPRTNGTANQVLTTDGANGVAQLSWKDVSALTSEPLQIQGTTTKATLNDDNVYQKGNLAVGDFTGTTSTKNFEVKGDLKALTLTPDANGMYHSIETNIDGATNIALVDDPANPQKYNILSLSKSTTQSFLTDNVASSRYVLNHATVDGQLSQVLSVNNGTGQNVQAAQLILTAPGTNGNIGSALGALDYPNDFNGAVSTSSATGTQLVSNYLSTANGNGLNVDREKGVGINSFLTPTVNGYLANYYFPKNNGAPGQVLVTDGTVPTMTNFAQLSWADASILAPEPWQVQGTTNKATLNTDNIYQQGRVSIGTQNGIGTFHVDPVKDNPTTGTPTATQVLDDFIITPKGRIGIGYSPSDLVVAGKQLDDKMTFQANDDLDVNYSLATTNNAQAIVHRNIISSGVIGARTARPNGTSIAAFEGHTSTSSNTYGGGSLITQQRAGIVLRTGKYTPVGGEIWFGTSGANADGTAATAAGNAYRAILDEKGNWAFGADPNGDVFYRNPTQRLDLILGGVRIGALGYGALAAWRTAEAAERPNYISTDPADRLVVADANGVLKTKQSSALISTNNGITKNTTTSEIELGGTLNKVTAITTDATNTLAIAGLQAGTATDKVVVVDANSVLKTVDATSFAPEPWKDAATTNAATLNTQDIYQNGNVGIHTVPNSALTVNGSANNLSSFDAAAGTAIDFSKSNLAYSTADRANTFTLLNLKDGGTYTLALKGADAGTAAFTAAGFTVHLPVDHGPSVAGKHSVYTMVVMGTDVYMSWIAGF